MSQERRRVRGFSLDVLHRGALDRHPTGCDDYFCEDLKPHRERSGSRVKGESE